MIQQAPLAGDCGRGTYLGCTLLIALLAMLVSLVTLVSFATAENSLAQPIQPATLEVVFDQTTNLLSIHAHQAPLDNVLQAISATTALPLVSLTGGLAGERISLAVHRLPLAYALQEVLTEFNTAFLYASAADTAHQTRPPRLVKVFVLSKKARTSLEVRAPTKESQPTVEGADLLQALSEQQSLEALRRMAQALRESGREEEREETVAALFDILRATLHHTDLRAYHDILAALKELAPERAVDSLVNLLQDQDADRRVRLWAAQGLGAIGTEWAVAPLIAAFDDPDAAMWQAAATGLARGGTARGIDFLVQLFSTPSQELHRTAFMALGFQGGDQGKAALRRVMTEGRLAQGSIPPMIVDELWPSDQGAGKEVGAGTADR
jgi:HEAT repeats